MYAANFTSGGYFVLNHDLPICTAKLPNRYKR